MELYFIRHAIAVERDDPSVKSDEARWLTEEGIEKMESAARGLKVIVPELDAIYTSPFVRARQTAEIVARKYGKESKVKDADELMPGAHFTALHTILKKHNSHDRIALVGHEPDFSELIARAIAGSPVPEIEMKKGAVCRVDIPAKFEPGSGALVWLLPPAVLRKITA